MKYLPDVVFAVGLGICFTGIWHIYQPAAVLFAGVLLCVIGHRISE